MNVGFSENRRLVSFYPYILLLFYAPIFNAWIPKTNFGSGIPDLGLYEVCVIVWVFSFMVDLMLKRVRAGFRDMWFINMAIYMLWVFMSISWSYEGYTFNTVRGFIFNYLAPFFVCFATGFYLIESDIRKILAKHAIICCLILSLVSYYQFKTNLGAYYELDREVRAAATLGNANLLAIYLVLNVPVFLYALKNRIINKYLLLFTLVCVGLGVFGTVSRKGMITFVTVFMIFFTLIKNYSMLVLAMILLAGAGAYVMQQDIVANRFSDTAIEREFRGKGTMIKVGLILFTESPIIGKGYAGYWNYSKKFFKRSEDAHNNYLTALVDYGIIGFIFFMGIFLIPVWRVFRVFIKSTPSDNGFKLASATATAIILPFMANAYAAGALMHSSVVTSLLYVYIVVFALWKPKVDISAA